MKQIPFVALPAYEQEAVLAALREAGVESRSICISRLELVASEPGEVATMTTVSGPGWYRTYPWTPGWVEAFTQDLRAESAGMGTRPVAP